LHDVSFFQAHIFSLYTTLTKMRLLTIARIN